LAAFCLGPASGLAADTGKPAKKDTNPRVRPKEISFASSASPAEAKPGEIVTYKVTAKVNKGFHLYSYAKEQPQTGPRRTQFDFFEMGGLEKDGDWTADQEPHRQADPNFDNQIVEFHENQVTWTLRLKVPADAKPGQVTLRNQVGFQICDDKSCKPPTYITLPDAKVTIKAGGSAAIFPGKTAVLAALMIGQTKATAAAPAKPRVAGGIQAAIDQGLPSFLLMSAAGGFFAVLMPCVWPMVPITVSFFLKQGQSRHGRPTVLAFVYCGSIIAIFTLVGLLCSIFLGAAATNQLAFNPWLNSLVALAFLVFGLSLLGLYELRLPSFLLNASARGEGLGGLLGVFFMALTLTITSFTCTFPVVGGLLVMATRGQYFYPILGMLTFATVLALPFFLLALSPGLVSRMPRSGDWMNAVKIIMGLVEIGAAFKFVNAAEIGFGATPEHAWFDARVVLTIWVVMAAVCGVYLLGLFRTDHDHDAVKVGPVRMLSGALFLILALYLAPALFGMPPQGKVYGYLVGILPPDAGELDAKRGLLAALSQRSAVVANVSTAAGGSTGSGEGLQAVEATSKDPEKAVREQKTFHGVQWGLSLDAALDEAKTKNRPVLIDFTGVFCTNCRAMEATVFTRPDVIAQFKKFVTVQLYTDQLPIESITPAQRTEFGEANLLREVDLIDQNSSPYYAVLTPKGNVIASTGADMSKDGFRTFLETSLAKFEKVWPEMMARKD
jgi:thiol:disulfide interchange protein DsbD